MDFDSLPDDTQAAQKPQTTLASNSPAPSSFDSLQDDAEKYGSTGQQIITGLEGAAQGVAGPLAPMVERAFGVPAEDIRLRAETNPWTHGLSEAGGFAAGIFTGGSAASLIGKAGAAAKGAVALGTGSKILQGAGKLAAEMALIQASDEATKAITKDPNQSVGSAVTNIGLSGLIGGVTGGALTGTGMLAAKGWEKVGGPQFLEDFRSRMHLNMSGENSPEKIVKELTEHYGNITDAAEEVYGAKGLKAHEIEKLMPQMHEGITQQANELAEKAQGAVQKLGDDPLASRLSGALSEYTEAITPKIDPITLKPTQTPSASQVFDASQKFKQKLQDWGRFSKIAPPPIADRNFVNTASSLSHDFRVSLEDSSVWGGAADRQKAINKAFSEYLPTLKDFESKFTTKVAGEPRIDPTKIQTYLNQNGRATSQTIRQEMLGNFLDKSDRYAQQIAQASENLGLESPLRPIGLAATRDSLEKLSPGMKAADMYYKRVMSKVAAEGMGGAAGGAIGAGIGHATGIPYAGYVGGLFGTKVGAKLGEQTLPAIIQPLMEKAANHVGFQQALGFGAATLRGESDLLKGVAGVFAAGAKTIPQHLMPDPKSISDLEKQVRSHAQNMGQLFDVSGEMGHYLPDHASAVAETAARAVQTLESERPKPIHTGPLDREIQPSKGEQAAYYRKLMVAQQPLTVLQHIKSGTLLPQDVATLRTLYPNYYNKMSQELTNAMANHLAKGEPVPYRMRQSLSLFLGQPLDSTMKPASIQAIQLRFSQGTQPDPSQGGQAGPAPKKSTAKLSKIAQDTQTLGQAREQRAHKV